MRRIDVTVIPKNGSARSERAEMIVKLSAIRDDYVERLDTGAAAIEEARLKGKDVTQWEDYWIMLLRQYESVCDKIRSISASEG